MEELLVAELGPRGLTFERLDVDEDSALRERFGEVVPVLLRDGTPVAKVRLSAPQLARILRRRRV